MACDSDQGSLTRVKLNSFYFERASQGSLAHAEIPCLAEAPSPKREPRFLGACRDSLACRGPFSQARAKVPWRMPRFLGLPRPLLPSARQGSLAHVKVPWPRQPSSWRWSGECSPRCRGPVSPRFPRKVCSARDCYPGSGLCRFSAPFVRDSSQRTGLPGFSPASVIAERLPVPGRLSRLFSTLLIYSTCRNLPPTR